MEYWTFRGRIDETHKSRALLNELALQGWRLICVSESDGQQSFWLGRVIV